MDIHSYHGPSIKRKDHHLYIAPAPQLADMIAHYTITYASGVAVECEQYHILPDASGCLIFQGERLDFWGPMSELVVLKNDLEEVQERFFVEFLPGGLYQLLGIAQAPLLNQRSELSKVAPMIAQQFSQLWRRCTTYDEWIDELNAFFMEVRKTHTIPSFIPDVLQQIDDCNGMMKISELMTSQTLSQRQLLRDFRKYIGMSIKEYAGVVRINRLLQQIHDDDFIELAMQGGFFDQAHFNKVFKQVTQTTPTKYIENLTDFYLEMYKF